MAKTNTDNLKKFIYIEGSNSFLKRVSNPEILANIIDPTTGNPYDGIILEGEFASMDTLNNNNRLYSEENYIGFVEQLKIQAHSAKGLYGEAEHPKTYSTDVKAVSHKILDIWYNKSDKKVYGIIMLLNTQTCDGPREIVKSGGQLAVSARGGGSEIKNPDGTITAVLKLMITFDIVYHPGFTTSIVNHTNLNETQNYSLIYQESKVLDNLNESSKISSEQKHQQDVMESGQTANQDEIEDDLEDAVDEELSQAQKSQKLFQQDFHLQMNRATGKFKNLNKTVYDGSAGFLTEDEE